jgi:ATP-grasp domain
VPTKILLTDTSWWPCASRLAMGLTKAGCEVSAVYPASGHPLSKTSVIHRRFPYRATDPPGSVRVAIEAVDPDIVVPCDDRAVGHLHELYALTTVEPAKGSKVRALIENSLGSPESYPTVSSRYSLLKIAGEEGIRIPETKLITGPSELTSGQSGLKLPWVLKADGSWGGHGVKMVQHPRQAEQFFLELSKPLSVTRFVKRLIVDRDPYWLQTWWRHTRRAVVVQSYIDGRPANSAVLCWKGEVLASIAVEVVSAQGATGPATIVRVVDSPEMSLAAQRLARRLGLSGIYGLDFMIEEPTGDLYLIEMNPRGTPLCHLQLGPGRDLISGLKAQLSGLLPQDSTPVTQCDTIAYFPQAWHWDPKSQLLQSSFHDVPWEEPELVQELLRLPWPERSILARVSNLLRRATSERRAERGGVFEAATAGRKSPEARGREV